LSPLTRPVAAPKTTVPSRTKRTPESPFGAASSFRAPVFGSNVPALISPGLGNPKSVPETAPLPSNFNSSVMANCGVAPGPMYPIQVPESESAAAPPDCAATETADEMTRQASNKLLSLIEFSPLLVIASEQGGNLC